MVKAIVLAHAEKRTVQRERRFPTWRAFDRFARGLAQGRWRRVYWAGSGSYLELAREGLEVVVVAKELEKEEE